MDNLAEILSLFNIKQVDDNIYEYQDYKFLYINDKLSVLDNNSSIVNVISLEKDIFHGYKYSILLGIKEYISLVDFLNGQQNCNMFHPFTCDRSSDDCVTKIEPIDHSGEGVLIATEDGWICPCGKYKQKIKI